MPRRRVTFDSLQADAFRAGVVGRTTQSLKWFRRAVQNLTINRRTLLKDDALKEVKRPQTGKMYMYTYDPKTKEDLPYYDKFPLIFMVGPAKGGFYGCNLHYLDLKRRAILFDKLTDLATAKNYTKKTRLRISYDLLSSASKYKEFAPCFKRYLLSHVKSRMVEVPSTEWEVALFMPTDQFVKNKRNTVWRKSNKLI